MLLEEISNHEFYSRFENLWVFSPCNEGIDTSTFFPPWKPNPTPRVQTASENTQHANVSVAHFSTTFRATLVTKCRHPEKGTHFFLKRKMSFHPTSHGISPGRYGWLEAFFGPQSWWVIFQMPAAPSDKEDTMNLVDWMISYGWWFRNLAITSWYGKCTTNYRVLYIPGGAGFPSTVCLAVSILGFTIDFFYATQIVKEAAIFEILKGGNCEVKKIQPPTTNPKISSPMDRHVSGDPIILCLQPQSNGEFPNRIITPPPFFFNQMLKHTHMTLKIWNLYTHTNPPGKLVLKYISSSNHQFSRHIRSFSGEPTWLNLKKITKFSGKKHLLMVGFQWLVFRVR